MLPMWVFVACGSPDPPPPGTDSGEPPVGTPLAPICESVFLDDGSPSGLVYCWTTAEHLEEVGPKRFENGLSTSI